MIIENIIENEDVDDYLDLIKKERTDLKSQLQKDILEVTFTKVNGDKRVMNCTLMEGIVRPEITEKKKNTTEKKVNEEVLSVWDIDAHGWRSFRINNVTRVRTHS